MMTQNHTGTTEPWYKIEACTRCKENKVRTSCVIRNDRLVCPECWCILEGFRKPKGVL